ncbi:MAG: hypothetical protein KFB93_08180 [Simkaniaceae bacterium]|nr:MAG: hypothetical protein KFB93_08180 [Simkaniaceae bacterium]
MEICGVSPDENSKDVAFEDNNQGGSTSSIGVTSSKTSEVSAVILSRGCYVLPKCMETFIGSVTHVFSSFGHFFS